MSTSLIVTPSVALRWACLQERRVQLGVRRREQIGDLLARRVMDAVQAHATQRFADLVKLPQPKPAPRPDGYNPSLRDHRPGVIS